MSNVVESRFMNANCEKEKKKNTPFFIRTSNFELGLWRDKRFFVLFRRFEPENVLMIMMFLRLHGVRIVFQWKVKIVIQCRYFVTFD